MAATNQGCKSLVPGPDTDARFVAYVAEAFLADIQIAGTGTTFQEVSGERLGAVRLPRPDRDSQSAISDFLDRECERIEALSRTTSRAGELVRSLRQSEAEELVWPIGPDGPILRGMEVLGRVPSSWTLGRNKNYLVEVADLSDDGSEELLSVSHIHGVTTREDSDATMFLAGSQIGYKRVKPGDLVMNTMWVWMGALGVSPVSGIVSPAYSVYRIKGPQLIAPYADLLYRSTGYVAEMTRRSTGVWSSRLRLYPDRFLAMPVAFPPVAAQRAIVQAVNEGSCWARQIGNAYAAMSGRLNEYREALITEAVTGQLDVAKASEAQMEERLHAASEGRLEEVA